MSLYYIFVYIITEGVKAWKRIYMENDFKFNLALKFIGLSVSSILAIFVSFEIEYYIPVMFTLSAIFLVIQTMTIINLSFDLTMELIENNFFMIVGLSVIGYSAIIGYCIYHLINEVNIFLIVHLLLLSLLTVLSILPKIQEKISCSGLLSSCIVGLQATFLLVGTITSGALNETVLVVGLIINILSLIRSVLKHATSWNHPLIYHFIILLSLSYFASIITNWDSSAGIYDVGKSEVGFWIKVGCSWFTFVLYGYCLLAPLLFPQRDFGYQSDTSTF